MCIDFICMALKLGSTVIYLVFNHVPMNIFAHARIIYLHQNNSRFLSDWHLPSYGERLSNLSCVLL